METKIKPTPRGSQTESRAVPVIVCTARQIDASALQAPGIPWLVPNLHALSPGVVAASQKETHPTKRNWRPSNVMYVIVTRNIAGLHVVDTWSKQGRTNHPDSNFDDHSGLALLAAAAPVLERCDPSGQSLPGLQSTAFQKPAEPSWSLRDSH